MTIRMKKKFEMEGPSSIILIREDDDGHQKSKCQKNGHNGFSLFSHHKHIH